MLSAAVSVAGRDVAVITIQAKAASEVSTDEQLLLLTMT